MATTSLATSEAAGESLGAAANSDRSWRAKFADALRGLKLGIRGHSSFFVHFFFTALAIAAAGALRCSLLEWCLLLGCIGLVLVAEMLNSAIEMLFHGLDAETRLRVGSCLGISAGAVLVASGCAVLVGAIVFLHRIGDLLF